MLRVRCRLRKRRCKWGEEGGKNVNVFEMEKVGEEFPFISVRMRCHSHSTFCHRRVKAFWPAASPRRNEFVRRVCSRANLEQNFLQHDPLALTSTLGVTFLNEEIPESYRSLWQTVILIPMSQFLSYKDLASIIRTDICIFGGCSIFNQMFLLITVDWVCGWIASSDRKKADQKCGSQLMHSWKCICLGKRTDGVSAYEYLLIR